MLPIRNELSFSEAVQAALSFLRDYISKWIGQPVDIEASWKPKRNKAIIKVSPAKGKEGMTTMSDERSKPFEVVTMLRPTTGQEIKGDEESIVQEKQSVMALSETAAAWKAGMSMAMSLIDEALKAAEDEGQKNILEGVKAQILATRNKRIEVACGDF